MENIHKNKQLYACELCYYTTCKKFNLSQHFSTRKHILACKNVEKDMDGNTFSTDDTLKYNCTECNYFTNIKNRFDSHLLSEKHKRKVSGEHKENRYTCSICNIEYSNNSGLWKHKKKCIQQPPIEPEEREPLQNTFTPVNNVSIFTPEMFLEVIKQNKVLIEKIDTIIKNQEIIMNKS